MKNTLIRGLMISLILISFLNLTNGQNQGSGNNEKYDGSLPKDFPYDYVVEESWINCTKGDYVFKKDNSFIFIHGCNGERKDYDFGHWNMNGDSILIETNLSFGTRPVGEPDNPEAYGAAVPEEYLRYGTYVNYETWGGKRIIIDKNDFLYEMCVIKGDYKASDIDVDSSKYLLKGKYKVASCRLLNEFDIADLKKNELRIMRNEIFARYGYKFKSVDLRAYFSSKEWYDPWLDNADEYLTDTERLNIKLIQKYERK